MTFELVPHLVRHSYESYMVVWCINQSIRVFITLIVEEYVNNCLLFWSLTTKTTKLTAKSKQLVFDLAWKANAWMSIFRGDGSSDLTGTVQSTTKGVKEGKISQIHNLMSSSLRLCELYPRINRGQRTKNPGLGVCGPRQKADFFGTHY